MVVRVGLFTVHAVVPLNIGVSAKFPVGVAGQPFLEDSCVHVLKRFWNRAVAVKNRPLALRELVNSHSFRNFAACVFSCNKIAELAVTQIIDADTVLADAVVDDCLFVRICRRISCVNILCVFFADFIPEFRDFSISSFFIELFLKADDFREPLKTHFMLFYSAL